MSPKKYVTNVTNVTTLINKGSLSVTKCDVCDVINNIGDKMHAKCHNVTKNVTAQRIENQMVVKNVTL